MANDERRGIFITDSDELWQKVEFEETWTDDDTPRRDVHSSTPTSDPLNGGPTTYAHATTGPDATPTWQQQSAEERDAAAVPSGVDATTSSTPVVRATLVRRTGSATTLATRADLALESGR